MKLLRILAGGLALLPMLAVRLWPWSAGAGSNRSMPASTRLCSSGREQATFPSARQSRHRLRAARRPNRGELDLRQLEGTRIYAIVEENPEHFVTKLWLRPDLPPNRDPVNPGVGATHLEQSQGQPSH